MDSADSVNSFGETWASFTDWLIKFSPGSGWTEVGTVLVHLAIALVLGQILAWHYQRFAQVLSNKRKFARIFPFIAGTTFLIITVVKVSLALSLGLVGALSIIRFRTPIKEPEELAYLFLAIAAGVGLGAERPIETVLVFAAILLYVTLSQKRRGPAPMRTVVQVTAPLMEAGGVGAAEIDLLLPAVEGPCDRVDLRRVDCFGDEMHASLLVEFRGADRLRELLTRVQTALPGSTVSVVERDGLE